MRWKDGGINYCSGTAKIVGTDPYICIHDNGTSICNRGHKISTAGGCRSQSLGKSNSTDGTFQPTYSVCLEDYASRGYSKHIKIKSGSSSCYYNLSTATTVSGVSTRYLDSIDVSKSDILYGKLATKIDYFYPEIIQDYVDDFGHVIANSAGVTTLSKVLQRDSGYVLRFDNSYSDLYDLDTYGKTSIIHPYYYTLKKQVQTKFFSVDSISGEGNVLASGIGISSPGETGENPTDICVGDQTAPTVANRVPTASVSLVGEGEGVSFDIVDSTGGVKKSSLYITVSGNLTSQPGGESIVEAGVVQVPSYASIEGTQTRYTVEYSPPSDWQQNEQVTITVTGSDNLPLDEDDEEFSCVGGVNTFYDSWSYKVKNTSDFSASITAVADLGAPYLENIVPEPYLGYIGYDSNITFDIVDDLSGVDINTLDVYIDGTQVVRNGEGLVSGAEITGSSSRYSFVYTNSSSFSYSSRIFVQVEADDLYAVSPNSLNYTYYFDVVNDSTVEIENFVPEVGITWNPELLDIEVDVIDRVYDIDVSNLYLSINGDVCSSVVTPVYGNRYLTTTVSGVDYICGTDLRDASIENVNMTGATVSGSVVYNSSVSYGDLTDVGYISDFPSPFSGTTESSTISGVVFDATVVSGTITTPLVSGVNWDGKSTDSVITGVSVESVYAQDVCTSGTTISGTIGRHLSYHPSNDFNFSGAINVLVHGTNLSVVSPVTREVVYQLLYGYNIKSFDRTFSHGDRVNVYLNAKNSEDYHNEVSYGFYFDTIDQQSDSMTASITGIAPWEDLSASIEPQAPVHKYGKIMEIILYAEDLDGNALGPYTFSYTIEEAPV